jgi:hypothetical protein
MQFPFKNLLPLLAIFTFILAVCLSFSSTLDRYHIDTRVILAANLFFLLITFFSFLIQLKGIRQKNPHVFVRSVMTGMLLKMVLCIAAVILYVYASGQAFNKRGVFISLFLYLLYLAAEVLIIMKMNKKKNA